MLPLPQVWAGMPTVQLTDIGRLRLQSISFFVFVFLVSAGLIALVWGLLRRDFPALPRLGYGRALGLTLLWGLLFVLVLTMISGARELLTPGAWERQGWTSKLAGDRPEGLPAPEDISEAARRKKIEELRFALWDHARKNAGAFPSSATDEAIPAERWQVPGPSGMRYLYAAPPTLDEGEAAVPLAWEPEVFGPQRLVLFSDGSIGSMDSVALARATRGGQR